MVVSGNPTEEQNVLAVPVKRAAGRGAELVVVDARETELTRYATHWLRPRPGTEVTLLGGIVKTVLDEALENKDFVRDRLDGIAELKREAWSFDLLRVAEITGVDQDAIRAAARAYATSAPAALLFGCDSVVESERSDLVAVVVNLALVTGNIGREGGGLYPLYSGANTRGAGDVGCAPGSLPGLRAVASSDDRSAIGALWGGRVPGAPGMGVREMIEGVREGRLKALVVMADGFNPDAAGLTEDGLPKPEFLVVSDAFMSDIAASADVLFPAATYAEVTGTVTNLERRVQLLRAGLELRNEERAGWATLAALGAAMGASGFEYESSEAVFAEIAQAVPAYAGLSHARLADDGGVQWPAPAADKPGTPVLYTASEDAPRLSVAPMAIREPLVARDDDYPLVLAHGRVLLRPEEDLTVVRDGAMNRIEKDTFVEIHPDDAAALGIAEGDRVAISARPAAASPALPDVAIARLTSPLPGLVSVTTLFADVAVDMQNSEIADWSPLVRGLPLRQASLAKAPAEREAGTLAD
jgi:predicted molibdopterin-dependent oxidoreductase YjgC